jgi:BirA family biotin operon repressor/biotin-[acetyl-CoA-carboxylase] ligase
MPWRKPVILQQNMMRQNNLLSFLRHQKGKPVSKDILAEHFSMPLKEVKEEIRQLQSKGFLITEEPEGFTYSKENDQLDERRIRYYAQDLLDPLYVFSEIDSTNTYARKAVQDGAENSTLVLANHQTAGRGRHGHSFYSPADTGLYLTLILRKPMSMKEVLRITPAAAVACTEAIRSCSIREPRIKWVNDLFIGKRKIAGILCETVNDLSSQNPQAVLIGIGINCMSTPLPKDIENTAGAINDPDLDRNELAAGIWKKLLYWTEHCNSKEMMNRYRKDSLIIGKEVTFPYNHILMKGTAISITEEGNLLVRKEDGSLQVLDSGEVSIQNWK